MQAGEVMLSEGESGSALICRTNQSFTGAASTGVSHWSVAVKLAVTTRHMQAVISTCDTSAKIRKRLLLLEKKEAFLHIKHK